MSSPGAERGLPSRLTVPLSIAGLVLAWTALALLNGNPRVLPGPWLVAPLAWHELVQGPLLYHVGATLTRVALSFGLAMAIGLAAGLAGSGIAAAQVAGRDPLAAAFSALGIGLNGLLTALAAPAAVALLHRLHWLGM